MGVLGLGEGWDWEAGVVESWDWGRVVTGGGYRLGECWDGGRVGIVGTGEGLGLGSGTGGG